MRKFWSILFFSIFCSFQVQAQVLEAKVNRDPVPLGEAFVLSLTLEGAKTNMSPEVSPLENDFNVYSIGSSTSIKIINGQRSENQQWNIGLIAKKAGNLKIPEIKLGDVSSQPISVNILDANQALQSSSSANGDSAAPRFSIKASADNLTPYVQQQITYTVTILDNGGLAGSEPQFVMQNQNDWIIKSISEPEAESKSINGKTVREIKFRYALFPQKSGLLKTPAVRFDGYYLTKGKRGYDPFESLFNDGMGGFGFTDMFATRNPVSLLAEPINIDIKPIPAVNDGQWWLPAQDVKIFAEWEPKNPVFKVGEAVNRTVYLQAFGVVESQLPNINFAKVDGIKQYPEKPEVETGIDQGRITAIKKISNVYIPNQTGKTTIPAIEVSWFNIKTQKMEKAILPEMMINVLPAVGQTEDVGNQESGSGLGMEQREKNMQKVVNEAGQFAREQVPNYKFYLFAGLAFVLGIGFSWFLFRPKCPANSNHVQIKDYRKHIMEKSKAKDFRALRDALIEWTAEKNPTEKVNNLKDVIRLNPDKDFSEQIDKLMAELYANGSSAWETARFIETFEKVYKKQVGKIKKSDPLPKLYKE